MHIHDYHHFYFTYIYDYYKKNSHVYSYHNYYSTCILLTTFFSFLRSTLDMSYLYRCRCSRFTSYCSLYYESLDYEDLKKSSIHFFRSKEKSLTFLNTSVSTIYHHLLWANSDRVHSPYVSMLIIHSSTN